MGSSIAVIIITALLTVIAWQRGRIIVAIGLILILGAMISNTSGPAGDALDTGVGFMLDLPNLVARVAA